MKLSHHAYLYEGALTFLPEIAAQAREVLGIHENGPDLQVRQYERFGIDEARALKDFASLKSVTGKSLVVIGTSSITTEAQQALLKLFEEPQGGAVFVLVAPHGSLLPTLRSRCLTWPWERKELAISKDAKAFLKMGFKERSAAIAALLKGDEGARERVRELINALERELYAAFSKKDAAAGAKAALARNLDDLALLRKYLSDRSPSHKMLLEQLAATLPKFA